MTIIRLEDLEEASLLGDSVPSWESGLLTKEWGGLRLVPAATDKAS